MLDILPADLSFLIEDPESLIEVVLDLGRPVEFRYPLATHYIEDVIVDDAFLTSIIANLSPFGSDNRSGIDGTLHRISRIVDRTGHVCGLTCRIGRAIKGSSLLIQDLLDEGYNVLIMGKPGKGKTSLLRDASSYLSLDKKRRVVIVDTSNEIAGDGRVPHEAVGRARRLQVPHSKNQHDVMIEAVENHMPEVIVIDEISTRAETEACRTIAQRGVQLLATAHGSCIEDLIKNPPLVQLIGGIQTVTLGDQQATQRNDGRKTVTERERSSIFTAIVEIVSFEEIRVHTDIEKTVDAILNEEFPAPEVRKLKDGSMIRVVSVAETPQQKVKITLDQFVDKKIEWSPKPKYKK